MPSTMDSGEMWLSVPRTHFTFLSPQGGVYSPAISGSCSIAPFSLINSTNNTNNPKINVSLIRLVTLEKDRKSTARCGSKTCLRRIGKRRGSFRDHDNSSTTHECTSEDTVMQCDLSHPPDVLEGGRKILEFRFSLPIPDNTPGTTETMLGNVSYAIRATAASASGRTIYSTQRIEILRRMVSGYFEPIEHFRYFQDAEMITDLCLIPKGPPDATTQVAYNAKLVAHRTTAQGARKTEKKHIIIKKLRWRVEETVNAMTVSCSDSQRGNTPTCKKQCVRELCRGKLKGHWMASRGPQTTENKDDRIGINLDIDIPSDAKAASGLDLSSYNLGRGSECVHRTTCGHSGCPGATAITIDHQLKFDIITGEDTFNQETGTLVDRKPLWKTFGASFPIPLYEMASGEHIPEGTFDIPSTLPRYENPSMMPPPYYQVAM